MNIQEIKPKNQQNHRLMQRKANPLSNCKSIKFILCIPIFIFLVKPLYAQQTYHKSYDKNGRIENEGWIKHNQKTAYWKFYYENGNLKKEGHFLDGLETKYWYFYRQDSSIEKEGHFELGKQNDWWVFYNNSGKLLFKCQFKNDVENGYRLCYKNEELQKIEQYKNGQKIKEWADLESFKKENKISDLK